MRMRVLLIGTALSCFALAPAAVVTAQPPQPRTARTTTDARRPA